MTGGNGIGLIGGVGELMKEGGEGRKGGARDGRGRVARGGWGRAGLN